MCAAAVAEKESSTVEITDDDVRLARLFTADYMALRESAFTRQGSAGKTPSHLRFAHYTSSEAAIHILRSRRIWMRSTTCMSDYREVVHGFEQLRAYFTPDRTKEFAAAFADCHPGVADDAIKDFNGWWSANLALNIYISSVSEHESIDDTYGRLSMWRAFGNAPTKVALVIKVPYQTPATQALGITFSPVAYASTEKVFDGLNNVAKSVREQSAFLKSLDRDRIKVWLFTMLLTYVSCLKHPGFMEEREWRGVYAPQLYPSELMKPTVEVVGGIPQHIFPLPLDKRVSAKLGDLDLVQMLDRVIIGPSQFPWVLYNSFVEILREIGVENAAEKVISSGIPIRT